METNYYNEQTTEEEIALEDVTYVLPSDAVSSVDEDAFSYADDNHTDEDDLTEETIIERKGKRKKSAERIEHEQRFLSIYEEYMHPTRTYSAYRIQCQLDDLYSLLCELNKSWSYRKAQSYKLAGFLEADGEDALYVGCVPLYEMLKNDRASNSYCTYPIPHYLKIAQNKAIENYFRTEFGRLSHKRKLVKEGNDEKNPSDEETLGNRKVPFTVSLDEPFSDNKGRVLGQRLSEAAIDPFANPKRPREERDEKSGRLKMMFLRELMDYPYDPPKPLALMYGNILFQLFKEYGGNDELSTQAKVSTKVSSPEWAHQRMGKATLLQLSIYSERIVQRCFSKSLKWGDQFRQHMLELTADGSKRKWANIIYTETYSEGNTSNWIESIMKSTMIKCSRKMTNNHDLTEYAIDILGEKNKFRKALEKMEKEGYR